MIINNLVSTTTILQELKDYSQWILWNLEQKNGRRTKVPYSKDGSYASVSDPSTWMDFEDAYATHINSNGRYSGIGFVFTESDPFIGFDWDHVRDANTGQFEPGILEEIKSLNSYAEISQSGEGAHVIAKGKVPGTRCRSEGREIYFKERFFVVTGNHLDDTPLTINEAPNDAVSAIYSKIDSSSMEVKSLDELKPRITDIEVIDKCKNASNGTLFDHLYNGDWERVGRYPSHSEADLALCNLLAAHTGDSKQIDRIFSGSGLYSDKWDRPDYKERTINMALEGAFAVEINPRDKYFEGKRFIVKSLADELLNENHFITLSDTGAIYHYDDGVYKEGGKHLIQKIALHKLGDYSSKHYLNEVTSYIQIKTRVDRESLNQDRHLINLENGLYDISTGTFKPHIPAVLSTVRIPVTYDPDATCPTIDKFLSEIVAPEDQQVLVEWAGYALIPDTRIQKAVMLLGNGDNGKSVYLNLLNQFIGGINTSSESLQNLENNRFSTANLYGKLLNVFPDLAKTKIFDNATFKSLCGGDRIRGERKFEGAFEFENTARLIFSANNLPPIGNGDFAFFRRWILIDFPNTFEGENKDINLIRKLTTPDELSGFLNRALAALHVLLENGEFSYTKTVEEVQRMYLINSNSVAAFASECIESGAEDTPKKVVYETYMNWCENNEIKPKADNVFGKYFKELGFNDSRESTGNRDYCWCEISVIATE
nr:phage/plasmid primase, P4 family [uncultured Methanolobus sp.]